MTNTQFARYDAYKDSGVEWLGEVPKEWNRLRIKEIISSIEQGWSPNAADWPTSNNGIGVLKLSAINNGSFIELKNKDISDLSTPKKTIIVKNGDVLITRSNTPELVGDSCFVNKKPYASLIIPDLVFRLNIRGHKVNPVFIVYALNSSTFRWVKTVSARGLNNSMVKISQGIIRNWSLFFPNILEQTYIANYLDTKTAKIDHKIELLNQKMKQYSKLKQSLINDTVTRGLDKTVSMKDSGVEWIGEVPEHWDILRVKDLASVKTGGKDTVDNVEGGKYPFFVRSQTIERINSFSFDGEAILTAGDGVGVGKVFHYVNEKFDYHQRVYKISHFKKVMGKFVFYYMRENFHKDALRLNAKSTVDSLRMPMFQNFVIVFGSLTEQKYIINYLDEKTTQIDKIVETIGIQIEKLKELRKTLINDVVTGKIKVVE